MKTYNKPCINVKDIELQSYMLTGSVYDEEGEGSTDYAKGRRGIWGDLWSDPEEEEGNK